MNSIFVIVFIRSFSENELAFKLGLELMLAH